MKKFVFYVAQLVAIFAAVNFLIIVGAVTTIMRFSLIVDQVDLDVMVRGWSVYAVFATIVLFAVDHRVGIVRMYHELGDRLSNILINMLAYPKVFRSVGRYYHRLPGQAQDEIMSLASSGTMDESDALHVAELAKC